VPPWPSETIAGSASHPSKSPLAPLPRSWISPRIFSTPVYEKSRLEPFGITKYYTDGWGAYERHIDVEQHHVGKENTQKIESKHINLRTRIKRLVRRTLCFSKTERMHDLVIGLFINRYEFGRAI